jgi:mono/diheme cytochrome c family protein
LEPFPVVRRRAIIFLLLWPILVSLIFKNTPSNAAEAQIAPQAMVILKANCFGCHNEEKKKGGLLLTSRVGLLKGNEDGPVVQIGKADQSKLIQALAAEADPHMPPKKQLSDKQISVLRNWIDGGAAWDEKALATFGKVTPLERLGSLPSDYEPVLALAMSPDGKWLAAGRGDVIALYDTASTNLTPEFAFREHRDAVQSLAWDAAGSRLASGAYREVLIWNLESHKREQRLTNSLIGRITALKFSPD